MNFLGHSLRSEDRCEGCIYTRVSGKSNRQDSANQSLQLIEYCQRQGWDYIEYTDRMSGTRADRTEFQRMFEDALLKHFDMVLFWALDRFSREGTLKTLEYLQRLDSYGQYEYRPSEQTGSILVITADGKGVVMRREDLREATKKKAEKTKHKLLNRLSRGEKRNAKRM